MIPLASITAKKLGKRMGKVTGEASSNSLVNLAEGGVITLDWVENYVKKKTEEQSEKVVN